MQDEHKHADQFDSWLAAHWKQRPFEVEHLLSDKTALRFLIAWSMFEGACFEGFMKKQKIGPFAESVASDSRFERQVFEVPARNFHGRYQDQKKYANLMHGSKSDQRMEGAIDAPFDSLSDVEMLYLLLFSVYRYRNNIFHGNKGVHSWLKYKTQIYWCLDVMQSLLRMYDQVDEDRRVAG